MKIPAYRNLIRQDLLDIVVTSEVYSDQAIDRAILRAVNDLSRLNPDVRSYEIIPEDTSFTETFNLADYVHATEDVDVQLSRKCLRWDSITVSVGATTYTTLDDYRPDHLNGIITIIDTSRGGDIPSTGTLTVVYKLSKRVFDLSSLTDLARIQSLDYPVNNSYPSQQEVTGDLIGQFLYISSVNGGSQRELNTGQRLIVYYYARYILPDDDNEGTLPDIYSEVVVKGAEAFLLFAKAINININTSGELDAALDLLDPVGSLLTTLATNIGTDITSGQSAIAAMTTALGLAHSSLASALTFIDTEVVADIALVAAALAAAVSLITTASGEVAAADTDTEGADAYTALANTALAAAITHQSTANTDIEASDSALTGATTYLSAGDNFIETVNTGKDPAAQYALYADEEIKIAQASTAEGEAILKEAQISVEIANGNVRIAEAFIQQGLARLKSAEIYIAEVASYDKHAEINQGNSQLRLKTTELYINDALGYVEEAKGYNLEAQIYLDSAKTRGQVVTAIVGAYIAEAQEARGIAEQRTQLANAIRGEANRLYVDFKDMISDVAQMRRNVGVISRKQI